MYLAGVGLMRLRSHAIAGSDAHGIDLAPMLDFVVNLLIFFIITAVFVKQAGIEVARPSLVSSSGASAAKSIVIDGDGVISIETKPIDLRSVRAHVEQFRATDVTSVVVVADAKAPTGVVVAVADQVRLAGIRDITFTTISPR
jgi:biopolymer transport protein ExbD